LISILGDTIHAETEEIRVVAAPYEPFVFYDKGKLSGFDIDLLDIICKSNNLRCTIQIVSFQDVLTMLKEGRADVGIGAIYVTDERKRSMDFTSPYLETGLVYVIRADSEIGKDLSNKRIGVKSKATGEIVARGLARRFGNLEVVPFGSTEESLDALVDGRVDVVINDYINTESLIHEKYRGKIKIKKGIGGFPELLTRDRIAIAINKQRPDLLRHFDSTLREMKRSGMLVRLIEHWPSIHPLPDYRRYILYGLVFTTGILLLSYGVFRYLRKRQIYELMCENERRFRSVLENAPNPIIIHAEDDTILFVNKRFTEITGYTLKDVMTFDRFIERAFPAPENRERIIKRYKEIFDSDKPYIDGEDINITCSDGSIRIWNMQTSPIGIWKDKKAVMFVARDVTEHRGLEEQFRQAQKMEVIGRFTGGIAHDFNNYLTAITGYSQLALIQIEETHSARQAIENVLKAADRASGLTRQLLAFSRRQILRPEVLNLNDVITEMSNIVSRIIGEDIESRLVLDPGLWNVKVDKGQIEQVIMNLVSNARDAMPDGGVLTIQTSNVLLDEEYAKRHTSVVPGEYVMMAIEDTGIGMSEDVKAHIFEPFFTTKELGKGTGLGLATVYGIVKQSGGNIWVYSEMGEGTTFKIYLPRIKEGITSCSVTVRTDEMPQGKETILVVEDNDDVRGFITAVLRELGYSIFEARDGVEALSLCNERKGDFDLVITDVIMPNMNGDRLASRIGELYPEIKVLYMSGYADNIITEKGILKEGINYLQKPITAMALAQEVRRVLDS